MQVVHEATASGPGAASQGGVSPKELWDVEKFVGWCTAIFNVRQEMFMANEMGQGFASEDGRGTRGLGIEMGDDMYDD